MKINGSEKRRGLIKLHMPVDSNTQELTAIEVIDDKVADYTILLKLIQKSSKRV